ncbi:MAG: hypothetical protein EB084_25770, partial [Proteobacteria bacterium]|nr:hypothetical protein [Pseudomonadota bacterium]
EKTDAIARLGFGVLEKVGLRFDHPFWDAHTYVFGVADGHETGEPTCVVNCASVLGQPLLVLLYGGEAGLQMAALSEEAARDRAMATLRRMFGSDIPSPRAIHRTGWSRDPFAWGAYGYVAVGATPADFAALAAPVGDRLYFAGEATHPTQWAAAHGAYLSGLREAARITDDEGLLPARHFEENRRWRAMMTRATRFLNLRTRAIDAAELIERERLLGRSEPFCDIDAQELRHVATMMEPVVLATGEWLCHEDDEAHHVYIVRTGQLEVCKRASEGIVEMLGPGDLVGEYALLLRSHRRASVRALTDCTLLSLEYHRFERFLLAFPQASLALLRRTIARFVK